MLSGNTNSDFFLQEMLKWTVKNLFHGKWTYLSVTKKNPKSNIGPKTSCSDLSNITGYRDAQFYSMKSKEI